MQRLRSPILHQEELFRRQKTLYVSSGKATGNIKTAKGGRTYYVRLRPYTTVSNTRYYGSYTTARAVRVK